MRAQVGCDGIHLSALYSTLYGTSRNNTPQRAKLFPACMTWELQASESDDAARASISEQPYPDMVG